jgi:hypothetical protein
VINGTLFRRGSWNDGAEYHGEFRAGRINGTGRFIFPPAAGGGGGGDGDGDAGGGGFGGGMYVGPFVDDCPAGTGYWQDPDGRWSAAEFPAGFPLRQRGGIGCSAAAARAASRRRALPPAPVRVARVESVAVCNGLPTADAATGEVKADFGHVRPVTARLVFARPPYADEPLWNAADCQVPPQPLPAPFLAFPIAVAAAAAPFPTRYMHDQATLHSPLPPFAPPSYTHAQHPFPSSISFRVPVAARLGVKARGMPPGGWAGGGVDGAGRPPPFLPFLSRAVGAPRQNRPAVPRGAAAGRVG